MPHVVDLFPDPFPAAEVCAEMAYQNALAVCLEEGGLEQVAAFYMYSLDALIQFLRTMYDDPEQLKLELFGRVQQLVGAKPALVFIPNNPSDLDWRTGIAGCLKVAS